MKFNKNFTKSTVAGFTLIELLVVIAIIGILSSIVLASLSTARSKGKDAAMEEQMSGARSQMELYAEGNGNNYGGGCASATGLGGGTAGISAGVVSDAGNGATWQASSASTTGQTTTKIYCGDAGSTWILSSPLNTAIGSNSYWCVDSTGASKSDIAITGATVTACP